MGISCGATLIKYLLFFFNLLWLALGAAIIYFGIRITSFSGDIDVIVEDSIKTGAIVVLVAGSVIFLIAFLGCCGACKENSCMLTTYGGIILILVIIQCVGAYLAFHYRNKIEDQVKDGFNKQFKQYDNEKDVRKGIQNIQKSFECCGFNGPEDYNDIQSVGSSKLPASCCNQPFDKDPSATCGRNEVQFKKGCISSVSDTVMKALGGLGGIAIALVLVQLLIVVSACCLAREVR